MKPIVELTESRVRELLSIYVQVRSPWAKRLTEKDVLTFIKYMKSEYTLDLSDIRTVMLLPDWKLNHSFENEKLIFDVLYKLGYRSRPWESPFRIEHIERMYDAARFTTQNRVVDRKIDAMIKESLDLAVGISDKYFPEWVDMWISDFIAGQTAIQKQPEVKDKVKKLRWEWIKK